MARYRTISLDSESESWVDARREGDELYLQGDQRISLQSCWQLDVRKGDRTLSGVLTDDGMILIEDEWSNTPLFAEPKNRLPTLEPVRITLRGLLRAVIRGKKL